MAGMKFEITTRRVFAAAHQLRLYDNSLEPLHGHNWVVRVTVGADQLDPIGVVMDFHDLDRQVETILGAWHNRHLNEVPEFTRLNPSTENVAVVVAGKLSLPAAVRVVSVEVWETEGNSAIYRP
jgi:6-pyruvoyltetrahydropterin/6-carboxytetrahydropterin synthase